MAQRLSENLRGEVIYRSFLNCTFFVYLVIIIFIADNEIIRDYKDLKIKDTFKIVKVNTDSLIYSGYGGASGTNWGISARIGENKKSIIKGYYFSAKADSIPVLNSSLRNDYVYYYSGSGFWITKKNILIFKIFFILMTLPFFYFVRKQHLEVQKMAPFGVDENYNPLPKPNATINYNKYG